MIESNLAVTETSATTTPGSPSGAPRRVRRQPLLTIETTRASLKQAFIMLRPDVQWKNPVMFVVEVGAVLTFLFIFSATTAAVSRYFIALDAWLWATVLFANFATALAEARGKLKQNLSDAAVATRSPIGSRTTMKSKRYRPPIYDPAIASWSRQGKWFPATAKSSKASPRSMNRPLRANRLR